MTLFTFQGRLQREYVITTISDNSFYDEAQTAKLVSEMEK